MVKHIAMKVIITGSNHFNNYDRLKEFCDKVLVNIQEEIEIVVANRSKVEPMAEQYAVERNYGFVTFYGPPENPKSVDDLNKDMADYSDALIAFWDGDDKTVMALVDVAYNKGLKIRNCNTK